MGKLENDLPKIVQQALKNEDDVTHVLVNTLLKQIYKKHNQGNIKTVVAKTLDDELDKLIQSGAIDIDNLGGAK
ncbi:MAG: hypothetical protein PUD00_03920 [Treponema berlinense]|uniref:hypothetical protein n=1 Tax=Treponema berlinense TaxID=225004 RepID=UPI0023F50C96|nr:hypothetical protein [Treponema berlinense]MDD5834360.1 hypothetical protein [Treponema berlinense]